MTYSRQKLKKIKICTSKIPKQRDQHTYKQKTKPKLFFLGRPQILQQPGIKMAYKGFNIDVRNYMEDCSSNPRDIILLFNDAYLVQMTQFLTLLGV